MSDLLIEFYSQEIPARLQDMAAQEFKNLFGEQFQNLNLAISIESFSTLYRLIVYIKGLPETLLSVKTEKKGPRTSADSKAIEGFIKANNTSLESLVIREVSGEKFYFYTHEEQGRSLISLLPDIFYNVISKFQWPKSMRWGQYDIRWIRPLQNILYLFNDEVIPITFGHLKANNMTFFREESVTINKVEDYFTFLKQRNIVLDKGLREKQILESMEQLALVNKLSIKKDFTLLNEVSGLIEVPKPLIGNIDEQFMYLPPEVLELVMKTHQKYFSTINAQGEMSNKFIFVTVDKSTANYSLIVKGNEKVLTNRLKDAEFFYNEDKKKPFESYVESLKNVTFHNQLGNYYNKALRIQAISEKLGERFYSELQDVISRAAYLSKADLVTKMVNELPELQGVMGSYYALSSKEAELVAKIIKEHYQPTNQDDIIPKAGSAIVALADKIDSVVGMFISGNQPKGSKDPYAVRRSALGIIKIVLENKFDLNLLNLIEFVIDLYQSQKVIIADRISLEEQIKKFFTDRFNYLLRSENYQYDLIEAVLSVDEEINFYKILLKLQALRSYFSKRNYDIVYNIRRIYNILGDQKISATFDKDLVQEAAEESLYRSLTSVESQFRNFIDSNKFVEALESISLLNRDIEKFFDQIMVNAEDLKIRNNRVALLNNIKILTQEILDFSRLIIEKEEVEGR